MNKFKEWLWLMAFLLAFLAFAAAISTGQSFPPVPMSTEAVYYKRVPTHSAVTP